MKLLDQKRQVFLPLPIDGDNPLNKGLLAWWQVMSGWDAGPTWWNLVGQNSGTLTGFTAQAWQSSTRPGGSGHLLFSGATPNYVQPKATTSASKFTISCWLKLTTTPATRYGVYAGSGPQGLHIFSNGGNIIIQWRDNTNGSMNGTKILAAGVWYWIVFTYDGTTATIYVNGNPDTSAAKSNYNLSIATLIGNNATSAGNPLDGAMDELILANRAWSAAEVGARYTLSQLGYPSVLSRVYPAHGINAYILGSLASFAGGASLSSSATAAVPPPSVATMAAFAGPLTFIATAAASVPAPSIATGGGPSPLSSRHPVYLPSPVNRDHSLNRSRLAWWMVLPGWDGGPTWYDLMGQNSGTLTSWTTQAWQSSTRPGGSGHLLFVSANSNKVVPRATVSASKFSIFCWVKMTTTPGSRWSIWGDSGAEGFNIFNNGGSVVIQWRDNTNGTTNGTTVLSAGVWYWIGWTYDGTTLTGYINGNPEVTSAKSNLNLSSGTSIGGASFFNGAMDDFALWGRPLAAMEVTAIYGLAQLVYPGVLNRVYPAHGINAYAFGSLVSFAGACAVSATVASVPPIPSVGVIASVTGPLTFVAVASAAVPPPSIGAISATAGPSALISTATALVPPPSSATLAASTALATFTAVAIAEPFPDDLMAAVLSQIRDTASLVAAFGEDPIEPGLTKFWADEAQPGTQLPWATYEEDGEDRSPTSPDGDGIVNYFCRGRLRFRVVSAAKQQSRALSDALIKCLNDAPLVFADGVLLELRAESPRDTPIGSVGPGSPTQYVRTVTFLYMVQRVF